MLVVKSKAVWIFPNTCFAGQVRKSLSMRRCYRARHHRVIHAPVPRPHFVVHTSVSSRALYKEPLSVVRCLKALRRPRLTLHI